MIWKSVDEKQNAEARSQETEENRNRICKCGFRLIHSEFWILTSDFCFTNMQVTLRVLSGPHAGRSFIFDQHDTFLIGRSDTAHLCLPEDRFFSRNHCLLEIAPPRCFLRDLGSTNGTYVNGQKVQEAYLRNGDRIQGGQTFLCEDCRAELRRKPQPVPGYEMVKVLGRGGMGCVMLARNEQTGEAVAIKTLLPEVAVSDQALRRFMREIDVAAALQHPHIVRFIDRGTNKGVVYLITEFVEGADAARLADSRGGRLPYQEVVKIISQALDALSFAHSNGYIHRDIKDQNILVSGTWPDLNSKLTDFGLAKSFTQTGMSGVTMAGDVAGTFAYMPPEQIRDFRNVRPTSDLYAMGMTAYSLLTGTIALDISPRANVAETVKAIFEKPIIPVRQRIPEIPDSVAQVIERAITKDIAQRWPSAEAMRVALSQSI
ncbi:MAG: hypothetical protein DMF68_14220 [Acidobacteria bacterium]|nr:MAG: hypothetical protein DMF68_14220 [Acidobacteriota bacterium]